MKRNVSGDENEPIEITKHFAILAQFCLHLYHSEEYWCRILEAQTHYQYKQDPYMWITGKKSGYLYLITQCEISLYDSTSLFITYNFKNPIG